MSTSQQPSSKLRSMITGITGQTIAGVAVPIEHSLHLEMPQSLTQDDMKRVERDCHILIEKLKDHPQEVTELFEATVHGKQDQALRLLRSLHLTEEEILAQGGGLFFLYVVVVSALWLIALEKEAR